MIIALAGIGTFVVTLLVLYGLMQIVKDFNRKN
jgi:hypothetical protein